MAAKVLRTGRREDDATLLFAKKWAAGNQLGVTLDVSQNDMHFISQYDQEK